MEQVCTCRLSFFPANHQCQSTEGTGAKHITPVLHQLHLLPVHQRIRYKLAMTVYKCPHGLAPTYLADDWQSLPLLASDTYGPLAPGYCQYQEQGPRWGWGVLRSQVQSSGTVYQPPCEPQLSPHWRSLDIWRPTCTADRLHVWGPFMTRSTNLLINIIIIIKALTITSGLAISVL